MGNIIQYIRTNDINWNMHNFPLPTYTSKEESNRKACDRKNDR
jgi:hypothetical protein